MDPDGPSNRRRRLSGCRTPTYVEYTTSKHGNDHQGRPAGSPPPPAPDSPAASSAFSTDTIAARPTSQRELDARLAALLEVLAGQRRQRRPVAAGLSALQLRADRLALAVIKLDPGRLRAVLAVGRGEETETETAAGPAQATPSSAAVENSKKEADEAGGDGTGTGSADRLLVELGSVRHAMREKQRQLRRLDESIEASMSLLWTCLDDEPEEDGAGEDEKEVDAFFFFSARDADEHRRPAEPQQKTTEEKKRHRGGWSADDWARFYSLAPRPAPSPPGEESAAAAGSRSRSSSRSSSRGRGRSAAHESRDNRDSWTSAVSSSPSPSPSRCGTPVGETALSPPPPPPRASGGSRSRHSDASVADVDIDAVLAHLPDEDLIRGLRRLTPERMVQVQACLSAIRPPEALAADFF